MPVKLLMTSCQSTTDIIAMHGVDKGLFTLFRKYSVDAGDLAAFRADKSGALVGDRIAARYGWKKGRHVTLKELKGISFNICGIFSTQGSADDFLILTGRRFLQEAVDEQGISNRVMIRLNGGEDGAAVSQTIDGLPMTIETDTLSEEAFLSASLDQLADLVSVSRLVIAGIVGVVLIAMGNAISMATRQRRAEFAILRTLGFQKRTILGMVISEGAFQALLGGLLGCLIVQAVVSANLVKSVSTCGFTVTLAAGPAVMGTALGAIILSAALGSVVPAWNASRLKIVAAIRRED
jgi:putative ABC transport system permease protein